MRYADPRLVDRLAAAYVLGTLAGRARRRFERLRADRPDVALAVAAWEARLGRLGEAVPPVQPPARVWQAIAARTGPSTVPAGRRGRGWWPAGLGLGGVAAGLLAAWALFVSAPALFLTADQLALRAGERLPQSYVGLLTDADGNGKLLVSSLRHGRTLTVKVLGELATPGPGKHLVLWAAPAQGQPFVLATVPQRGSASSQLPATSEQLLAKVGRLLVSLEDSPAPARPGQVLYAGNCAKLW